MCFRNRYLLLNMLSKIFCDCQKSDKNRHTENIYSQKKRKFLSSEFLPAWELRTVAYLSTTVVSTVSLFQNPKPFLSSSLLKRTDELIRDRGPDLSQEETFSSGSNVSTENKECRIRVRGNTLMAEYSIAIGMTYSERQILCHLVVQELALQRVSKS